METFLIIQIAGIALVATGLFIKARKKRFITVLTGLLISGLGFIPEMQYTAAVLCLLLAFFLVYNYLKNRRNYHTVRMLEVANDDLYLQEFLRYYEKPIYNYFPMYKQDELQKTCLLIKEMNVAGLLVLKQVDNEIHVELDFIKPEYRDFSIGNYIYRQNTGYFKRMGANIIKAKSYHYLHSKYLLKMGFIQSFIDGELYFVKKMD